MNEILIASSIGFSIVGFLFMMWLANKLDRMND